MQDHNPRVTLHRRINPGVVSVVVADVIEHGVVVGQSLEGRGIAFGNQKYERYSRSADCLERTHR